MENRIQPFLTIMDTFHDFTSSRMTSIDNESARHLQKQIYQSLQPYFMSCLENDFNVIQNNTQKTLYKQFLEIFKNIYVSFSGTINFINNIEKTTIEIITKIIPESKIISIKKDINSIDLYKLCQTIYKTKKIIYILDANSFSIKPFCIKRTDTIIAQTNTTFSQHNNTIFKGLFNAYELMQFKQVHDFGALHRFIKSQTTLKTPSSEDDTDCVQVEDYFNYKLTKEKNELLFVDEIGVQMNINNRYYLYRKINTNEFIIDFRSISGNRGVPLFATGLKDVLNLDLTYIRNSALDIISKVFGIRMSNASRSNSSTNSIILNRYDYVYALFDFKRTMDYLQVKACIEGNKIYKDATYIFVSNDRLAIQYAILNNCPCLRTRDEDGDLYIPNEIQEGSGGTLYQQKLRRSFLLKTPGYLKCKPIVSIEQNTDIEIDINAIISIFKDELFGDFLENYKNLFNQDKISVFWYVVYFMIFKILKFN
jgi:hypothetical protein